MDELLRIEPTEDERRNGWTVESLRQYLQERERERTLPERDVRPVKTSNNYDPHRW